MGSAFHQLCPRYGGTLTPTAPTANRLLGTFTFTFLCRPIVGVPMGTKKADLFLFYYEKDFLALFSDDKHAETRNVGESDYTPA